MTGSTTNHAPSHLREQFQEWLDSYEPDRLPEIDIRPAAPMLDALADCTDVLPADYCDQLEIRKGSTYAQAVEEVRQWCPVRNDIDREPDCAAQDRESHEGNEEDPRLDWERFDEEVGLIEGFSGRLEALGFLEGEFESNGSFDTDMLRCLATFCEDHPEYHIVTQCDEGCHGLE